ncbi:competence type IV pilus minor pilin ComGD [Carnobacterium mobile]|uniref:competence type IV pilus minor pilin ComGD n=2 Tax=Carnobacterium mobile TaxID=2750 RepID=UPI000556809A|nr:competence type IV pilus minor pilin ComGD [Carnobacterium mobile]
MKRLNCQGMVFIEMLLVLLITATMLSVPTVFSQKIIKDTATQLFIEDLQSSITMAQNHAVLSGNWSVIDVSAKKGMISFRTFPEAEKEVTYQLQLPENVTTPSNKQYIFNGGSGNLQSFSTLYFDIDGIRHGLVFQLGSGRYHWD